MAQQQTSDLEISPKPPPVSQTTPQPPPTTTTTTKTTATTTVPPPDIHDALAPGDEGLTFNRVSTAHALILQGLNQRAVEDNVLKDRRMRLWDVISLNVNTMIGSGIFTTPGLILILTRSKALSLAIWALGGVYAMLGAYVYGRYAKYFPHNGGEILWLDTVFKRPRFYWAVVVGGYFLVLETTAGNCLAFARHVSLVRDKGAKRSQDFHRDSVGYIAVSVLTMVCFIHFFSPRAALALNKWFAVGKIVFLLVIVVAGVQLGIANGSKGEAVMDWGWYHGEKPRVRNVLSAIIYVVYSYMGWQTAFYVAGEVGEGERPDSKTLRHGTTISVAIVSVLYCLVTMAYSVAIPFQEITGDNIVGADLSIILNFIPQAFNTSHTDWAKVFIALSAFGYLISAVFAYSRVNQQIYRQRLFPLYQILDRDNPYYKTPAGGLFIHWVFTTLTIVVAPNTDWGYGFVINVKSYGHLLLTLLLGVGMLFIHRVKRERAQMVHEAQKSRSNSDVEGGHSHIENNPSNSSDTNIDAANTTTSGHENRTSNLMLLAGFILSLASLFLLIVSAAGRTDAYPAVWYWPVALAVVYGGFSLYWVLLRAWMVYSEKTPENKWSKVRVYGYWEVLRWVEEENVGRRQQAEEGALRIDNGAGPKEEGEGEGEGGPSGGVGQMTEKNSHWGSLDEDKRTKIKSKLDWRYKKYGHETLVVYEWTPLLQEWLRSMYTTLGIPSGLHKHPPIHPNGGSMVTDALSEPTHGSPRFTRTRWGSGGGEEAGLGTTGGGGGGGYQQSSLRLGERQLSFQPTTAVGPHGTGSTRGGGQRGRLGSVVEAWGAGKG